MRLAGGALVRWGTLWEAIAWLKENHEGTVRRRYTPRGWRMEVERGGEHFYIGLIMDARIHPMTSAYVDSQTGKYQWRYEAPTSD